MLKDLIIALISGFGTLLYDWIQKNRGQKALIENVGLKQKAKEDLEAKAVEREIEQALEDSKKEKTYGDHRDFEQ